MTDLTLKKARVAAAAGFALLVVGCGGRDQPALGAGEQAPTSVFQSVPSTVAAAAMTAPATAPAPPPPVAAAAPPAPSAPSVPVNTSIVTAQQTLDDVLAEVDQALTDIDSALADIEDNR